MLTDTDEAAAKAKNARGQRWGTVPYGQRVGDDARTWSLTLTSSRSSRGSTTTEDGLSLRSIVLKLEIEDKLLSRAKKPFDSRRSPASLAWQSLCVSRKRKATAKGAPSRERRRTVEGDPRRRTR